MGGQLRLFESVQRLAQHQIEFGILIAQIDVDVGGLHDPRGDQHSFEEAMGIAFEIIAVLERAGLAFVGIHAHQARGRFRTHDAPLTPRGEARSTKTAQTGLADRRNDLFAAALTSKARLK